MLSSPFKCFNFPLFSPFYSLYPILHMLYLCNVENEGGKKTCSHWARNDWRKYDVSTLKIEITIQISMWLSVR